MRRDTQDTVHHALFALISSRPLCAIIFRRIVSIRLRVTPYPLTPGHRCAFAAGYGFITRFLRHYVVRAVSPAPPPTPTRSIFPHFRPPPAPYTYARRFVHGKNSSRLDARIVFFFWVFFVFFFRYCYKLRLILFRTFIVSHFFPRPGLYH